MCFVNGWWSNFVRIFPFSVICKLHSLKLDPICLTNKKGILMVENACTRSGYNDSRCSYGIFGHTSSTFDCDVGCV